MKKLLPHFLTFIILFNVSASAIATLPEYGEEYQNQPTKEYSQTFKDVDATFWAFTYIAEMSKRGVLSGYPNGYFYPDNTITRAEFAKTMCLAAGLTVNAVNSTSYNDVNVSDWYAPFVECGKYYLSGYISDGKKYYKPDDKALREDIAVALVKLKGYDTSIYDESILRAMFTDWQSISEGARKYVSVAVENGLISGYDDNTFRGQASITRAEAATLLWRTYQYGNENKVFEKEEFDAPVSNTTQPEKNPASNPEELQKFTLTVDKTNITVNSGEIVEFNATVGFNFLVQWNEEMPRKGYIPSVDGDVDILESIWGSEKSTENNETITLYRTNVLKPGKYRLNFSITDDIKTHNKTVTITVNEPEPEYTYAIDTVAKNITCINKMIETDDGIAYFTGCKNVMLLEESASEPVCVFSADELEYLGTQELTKAQLANLDSYIIGIGFNQNNSHIYALIEQAFSESSTYYIYDVTLNSLYKTFKYDGRYGEGRWFHFGREIVSGDKSGYFISFDKDSEIYINGELIVNNILPLDGGANMGLGNNLDKGNSYITLMGKDFYKISSEKVEYKNPRNGLWEFFDYYIPNEYSYNYHYIDSSDENMLFTYHNLIYLVDKNGDSSVFCQFDDIDNTDGKIIDLGVIKRYKSEFTNKNTLYYYDSNYNSIRKLSKK